MTGTTAPRPAYRHPVPTNPPGDAFGALIRDGRRQRGITQEALETETGVSRSTITRWERGDASTPNPEHVRAVCLALGIDPREAAVALGYLTAADLTPTDVQRQPLDPTLAAIVAKLRDPSVSEQDKQAAASYIAYLHSQARNRREAAS
jgi:transcriptional regulator with XRE-family HTH domain